MKKRKDIIQISSSPKKLCLIIPSLGAGGAEKVVTKLANHWAKQGHQVFLIALNEAEKRSFYPLNSQIQLFPLNQPLLNYSKPLETIYQIWTRIWKVRRMLLVLQPDKVISFLTTMNLTTLVSGLGTGIPVIVSERIDPDLHKLPLFYEKIRPFLYQKATKIVVQTHSIKKFFSPSLQKKIVIIPNSISSLKNTHPKKNLTPLTQLVTVGRLDLQKDHQTLILAFSKVVKQYPNLELTIYGEGPERPNLENLIASLNLKEKILLPGTVKNIESLLAKADLFVFPSKYEGFPNALGEAMSIGLPVIASNCPGNTELVQDNVNGRLFPVGNTKALEQLLEELLQNPQQCIKLAQNAVKVSQTFDEAKILKTWDNLIRKIF